MIKERDHPFETSAKFHDFLPLPPYHRQNAYEGDFLSLCTVNFWPLAHGDTTLPLRHADVLNGWSQMFLIFSKLNRQSLGDFTKMEGTQMEMFNFLWLIMGNYIYTTLNSH